MRNHDVPVLRPRERRARWAGVLLLLLPLSLAAPAAAWSPAGHMVLGAVTYQELERVDPEALERVLALLQEHPHAGELIDGEADRALEPGLRARAAFMRATRWADDVRSEPWDEYSRPQWHYVNYRYRPPDELTPPRSPDQDGYLLWAIEENVRRLESDSDPVRAIALSWLFHLVTDLHQPLHTIALVDAARPEGDRGGNLTFVRRDPEADTETLHWVWDGIVHDDEDVRAVVHRARELDAGVQAEPGELDVEGDVGALVRGWAREGTAFAIEAAYLRGELPAGEREAGTLLPDGYLESAGAVAEKRAVLGARRLAHLLARLF